MADLGGGKFPRRYSKIYKPGPDECFLSRHLSKQSDVLNVSEGIHVATVPAKFWEQFNHIRNLKDLFECGLKKSSKYFDLISRALWLCPFSSYFLSSVCFNIHSL
ncbi:hypothetical protein P879_10777 [Paragonimus westermani]|uniref:Uncharacterized protein n=1 Tax=Paragonimus westermani TaxID=34504 RepID=A0A8T0DBE7_9TREM|nr:hypothetical protein P879_10777 [Paragonimus westermani]